MAGNNAIAQGRDINAQGIVHNASGTQKRAVPGHAAVVGAVEAAQRVAVEVGAERRRLVAAVAAVVAAVAQVQLRHAQVVRALEPATPRVSVSWPCSQTTTNPTIREIHYSFSSQNIWSHLFSKS